ncbi:MAG: AzlD domain-containing protein [Anaerolineae bacterium]|jgi:branched-subunit amino acid transport protein|nr:AzlD domain-containing protein [Anaerolineae bacterium]
MNEALLIFGMFLVTFLARYPLLVIVGRVALPQRVFRALRYVPVAVLTAIIVPAMLQPAGRLEVSFTNAYLVAGVVATGIAWRTRGLLPTIGGGMLVFVLWRVLVPGAGG